MKKIFLGDIHKQSNKLEVYMFNVGQGDHFLLKFPTLEYGIIDFHYQKSNKIGEPPCLSYFKALKRKLLPEEFRKITISFFCISHTDKDHIKGITDTLKWFYQNGVFVRNFWFSAARDEIQMSKFLKDKIDALISKFELSERLRYNAKINQLNSGIDSFFDYFQKWKLKKFNSSRYNDEPTGEGEYLVEIKELSQPSGINYSRAYTLGPLTSQVDKYYNNLTLNIIKNILKIKDLNDKPNKNLLSHILLLKYGEQNLLFGGDTNKEIWKECINKYLNPVYNHKETIGSIKSQFIKVSHHGSKDSSDSEIWKNIVPMTEGTYFAISAGRHRSWKHPHSETLKEIRDFNKNAKIFSTNCCVDCLPNDSNIIEHHVWYDEFIDGRYKYGKNTANEYDNDINEAITELSIKDESSENLNKEMGLFAYIFEISNQQSDEISVRVALSKNMEKGKCFFSEP